MASKELAVELADVQQELDGLFFSPRSPRADPQKLRRYGLLLAQEELLLLELRRLTPRSFR